MRFPSLPRRRLYANPRELLYFVAYRRRYIPFRKEYTLPSLLEGEILRGRLGRLDIYDGMSVWAAWLW